jgi:hypothetical protein
MMNYYFLFNIRLVKMFQLNKLLQSDYRSPIKMLHLPFCLCEDHETDIYEIDKKLRIDR